MVLNEMQPLILFKIDLVGRFFPSESPRPSQSLDSPTSRFDDQHAKRIVGWQRIRRAASQNDVAASLRKRSEDSQELSMVLGFGVMPVAVEAVVDEALDRISHALVETFDEMARDLFLSRNLVHDLATEESESELVGDPSTELGSARARESGEGNTGVSMPEESGARSGFVVGPALDLTIDHLVEGVGSRASHGITSEAWIRV